METIDVADAKSHFPSYFAQALSDCSPSARFTHSTAGGITSPMPLHTRSVTAASYGVSPWLTRTTSAPDLSASRTSEAAGSTVSDEPNITTTLSGA